MFGWMLASFVAGMLLGGFVFDQIKKLKDKND